MNRLSRTAIPLLALLALILVVFGIPAVLVLAVGWPVPSPLPTMVEIGDVFAGRTPVPADYLISVLAIVMWLIWAQIVWATVIEAGAALRGRMAGRAMLLPGVQLGVAKLVTTATLLATSIAVRPVSAGPLVPVDAALSIDHRPVIRPTPVVQAPREQSESTVYMTEPGDTWWGIAEHHLGSGTRWKEVRALNLGREMADGSTISAGTDMLRPDWRLLLPAKTKVGAVAISAPAGGTRSVTVERGDTIWGIAEEDLETDAVVAVAEHVEDISELNRGRLDGNPDLIYPGQRLELPSKPAPPVDPATPPPNDDPPPVAETPSTTAAPTTAAPTTAAPTSFVTPAPTTAAPTTEAPSTTAAPTTEAPSTAAPTTEAPSTTAAPTTDAPSTTAAPTTEAPSTTAASTTAAPTTAAPTTGESAGDEAESSTTSPSSVAGEPGSETPLAARPPAADADRSLAGATAVAQGIPVPTSAPDAGVPAPPEEPSPTGEFRQDPDQNGRSAPIDADAGMGPLSPADGGPELQTGVELSESELMASQAPGEIEDLDTQSNRAPVFVGLAALTLLGGYLHRARGRRRDTALRNRHPGRRPNPPKRRTRGVARRLAAAAEPEHPEFVNVGLRALGKQLQTVPADQLPIISGVWVSHNRLVIALADESPRMLPPAPFNEFADGSGWSLHRSDFEEARKQAKGANGPLPLLTTIGTTTALDLALTTNSRAPAEAYGLASSLLFAVDLEAGRVISVQASDDVSTVEALTMMALELATSESADQAEIVCVGFGHRLATFDRVTVVEDLADVLGDLETITGRAVYAAADASPFATRVGNGAADTWNPVIVFHADAFDPHSTTLVELAERTPGGVTAVCGYPTGTGWTLLVKGDRVSCPNLPGDLAHHEFKRPELDGIELIPDLFDEPWDEVELDDTFWQPMDPVEAAHTWHLLDSDETSWRPMASVTDPAKSVPTAPDPDRDPAMAVVVNQGDVESRPDPEDLWDSLGTSDPEAWPDNDIPALKELQHSIEHRPVDEHPLDADIDRLFLGDTVRPPDGDSGRSRHLYVVDGEGGTDPVDDGAPGAGGDNGTSTPSRTAVDEAPATEAEVDGNAAGTDTEAARTAPDTEADTDIAPDVAAPDVTAPATATDPDIETVPAAADDDRDDAGGRSAIQVSVLGNFTIEGHHVGDRTKPWKYTKTPELILYLLLHPAGASQDLLMEQLFPEQPPNRPRLNQLVSDARTKALGQSADGAYHLPHASPTEPFYKLLPTVELDLREFALHCANARAADDIETEKQEWTAALELVRGRPFTLPHDGYEWALPEIEATIVKVEEAAMALADIALDLEDYELAVWATKQGLATGTGYYELLVKRGRAALLLQDAEEIVRAFADLQVSLEYTGAPEEGMPDLSSHPDLEEIYNELSSEGRSKDRPT